MTKPLSPRMEEVVRLVVEKDLTYLEAAEEMGIAERTVRNYASEIGKRLGRSPRLAMAWYYYNEMEMST